MNNPRKVQWWTCVGISSGMLLASSPCNFNDFGAQLAYQGVELVVGTLLNALLGGLVTAI